MWSIAGLRPAMLHMKACWNPKSGHKLWPATPSHKNGQYWLSRPFLFLFLFIFFLSFLFYVDIWDGQRGQTKLAEVEIGRSRNWPKSKLAEVELAELEKKNWPKSKLAEVDHDQVKPRIPIPLEPPHSLSDAPCVSKFRLASLTQTLTCFTSSNNK